MHGIPALEVFQAIVDSRRRRPHWVERTATCLPSAPGHEDVFTIVLSKYELYLSREVNILGNERNSEMFATTLPTNKEDCEKCYAPICRRYALVVLESTESDFELSVEVVHAQYMRDQEVDNRQNVQFWEDGTFFSWNCPYSVNGPNICYSSQRFGGSRPGSSEGKQRRL